MKRERSAHFLLYIEEFVKGFVCKPAVGPVVPKNFSIAEIIYPSETRKQVAFSCGRRGRTIVVDKELACVKDTSSVSLRQPSSPRGRQFLSDCRICGGGAITASGRSFDEPIGSACEMPRGLSQATGGGGGHDSQGHFPKFIISQKRATLLVYLP